MDEFTLGRYPQSSVLVVYSERDQIELDPAYQRISGIWSHEKRQLLLDSLLNGFDVPKLYFHEFVPPIQKGGKRFRYAIIDGKQRLLTIWEFIDGKISLAEDFTYLRDDRVKAGGLDYQTLAQRYPTIKGRFDATPLDIVTIRTKDVELIEDMFSRLNEAVPLNAPERRNAFGGPIPSAIKKVAVHDFFKKRLPFTDRRYRHRDLSAKFLYLEYEDRIANTKKGDLDGFVINFRRWRKEGKAKASPSAVARIVAASIEVLDVMASTFVSSDTLLRQVGMVTLYYHLYRQVKAKRVDAVKRDLLVAFERTRAANRERVEEVGEAGQGVDVELLEFDKHSQTPNDAYAIRIRLRILVKFLNKKAGIKYDKDIVAPPE